MLRTPNFGKRPKGLRPSGRKPLVARTKRKQKRKLLVNRICARRFQSSNRPVIYIQSCVTENSELQTKQGFPIKKNTSLCYVSYKSFPNFRLCSINGFDNASVPPQAAAGPRASDHIINWPVIMASIPTKRKKYTYFCFWRRMTSE